MFLIGDFLHLELPPQHPTPSSRKRDRVSGGVGVVFPGFPGDSVSIWLESVPELSSAVVSPLVRLAVA